MPASRFVEEDILAAKRSVGVTPEVNLRKHITCIPLASTNKAFRSGFEIQRAYRQKSKTGVSVAPQKGLLSSETIREEEENASLHSSYVVQPETFINHHVHVL